MPTIHETIKKNSSSIAAIFSTITLIGGSVLYVETSFANAKDVKEIAENQQRALKIQSTTQRQFNIFQLEYYDDKLKKLQDEKRSVLERSRAITTQKVDPLPRGRAIERPRVERTMEEIQEDIDDIKKRREFVRKTLEE